MVDTKIIELERDGRTHAVTDAQREEIEMFAEMVGMKVKAEPHPNGGDAWLLKKL